jgi:hypothetical protein
MSMKSYQLSKFEALNFSKGQKSFDQLISKFLKTDTPFEKNQIKKLCENDELRGQIYRTLPNLSPLILLANDSNVLSLLEKLSSLPSGSFCCVNINIRIDFSNRRLQTIHNLDLHQDFHYGNPLVTPEKSYVLWAPLRVLSKKTGGIQFMKNINKIKGAVPHNQIVRTENMTPTWSINKDTNFNISLEEINLEEGEFLLFDMRHIHASAINNDPIFPRITLQARFSSFKQDGFLEYYKDLPS